MDLATLQSQLAAIQAAITASAAAKSTSFSDRQVVRHNLDDLLAAQQQLQAQIDAEESRLAGRMTVMTAKWTA